MKNESRSAFFWTNMQLQYPLYVRYKSPSLEPLTLKKWRPLSERTRSMPLAAGLSSLSATSIAAACGLCSTAAPLRYPAKSDPHDAVEAQDAAKAPQQQRRRRTKRCRHADVCRRPALMDHWHRNLGNQTELCHRTRARDHRDQRVRTVMEHAAHRVRAHMTRLELVACQAAQSQRSVRRARRAAHHACRESG